MCHSRREGPWPRGHCPSGKLCLGEVNENSSDRESLRTASIEFATAIWAHGDLEFLWNKTTPDFVAKINQNDEMSCDGFAAFVTAWRRPLRAPTLRIDASAVQGHDVAGRGTLRGTWIGPDGTDALPLELHAGMRLSWSGDRCARYQHEAQIHCPGIDLVASLGPANAITLSGRAATPWTELTPRQRSVAKAVLAGLSDKEIADQLGLRLVTIQSHVKALRRHFGVRQRTQLFNALSLVVAC